MKNRWIDRALLFVIGVFLILNCAAGLLLAFGQWLAVPAAQEAALAPWEIAAIAWSALSLLLAAYALTHALRKRGKSAFVVQATENGELRISIKAMENLVQKCVDMHEELHVVSTEIINARDGVEVSLRISLANNVSIPLAVSSLQKQIKQYIVACSGVDVRDVHVSVEQASGGVEESPYLVPEIIQTPQRSEPEEKQSLHQRIFGKEEQPAQVPPPPEMEREERACVAEAPEAAPEAGREPDAAAAPEPADGEAQEKEEQA